MAKPRNAQIAKRKFATSIFKFKMVLQKLHKSFPQLSHKPSSCKVPEDVKQGHLAVVAVGDDEQKRFIVPLSYLTHPTFLRLLEQAEEEYGFNHEGALTVPCRPVELERMFNARGVNREEILSSTCPVK